MHVADEVHHARIQGGIKLCRTRRFCRRQIELFAALSGGGNGCLRDAHGREQFLSRRARSFEEKLAAPHIMSRASTQLVWMRAHRQLPVCLGDRAAADRARDAEHSTRVLERHPHLEKAVG
eukprot:scaffold118936_cov28-Tisochrysis_lutea.AAC.7